MALPAIKHVFCYLENFRHDYKRPYSVPTEPFKTLCVFTRDSDVLAMIRLAELFVPLVNEGKVDESGLWCLHRPSCYHAGKSCPQRGSAANNYRSLGAWISDTVCWEQRNATIVQSTNSLPSLGTKHLLDLKMLIVRKSKINAWCSLFLTLPMHWILNLSLSSKKIIL